MSDRTFAIIILALNTVGASCFLIGGIASLIRVLGR